jgi:hypothetical protein
VVSSSTNEANPIIGDRAFAAEPRRAASLALAFADGLAGAGLTTSASSVSSRLTVQAGEVEVTSAWSRLHGG